MNTKLSIEPIIERNGKYYRKTYEVKKTNCATCQTTIFRKPREIKSGYPSYCSLKCKQVHHDPQGAIILSKTNDLNFYYFLGLLATDGYINNGKSKNGHGVRLGFAKNDESSHRLLQKIQQYFGGKIYEENQNAYYLYFYQKDFRDYLISIGITSNKSLTLDVSNWFNQLTVDQKWSFIRGCWDGDGCLTFFINKRGDHRGNASIVSASKSFALMIQTFLGPAAKLYVYRNKTYMYQGTQKQSVNPLYTISINSSNVPKILYKLYENLNLEIDLYLERKYKVYKTVESYYK